MVNVITKIKKINSFWSFDKQVKQSLHKQAESCLGCLANSATMVNKVFGKNV